MLWREILKCRYAAARRIGAADQAGKANLPRLFQRQLVMVCLREPNAWQQNRAGHELTTEPLSAGCSVGCLWRLARISFASGLQAPKLQERPLVRIGLSARVHAQACTRFSAQASVNVRLN